MRHRWLLVPLLLLLSACASKRFSFGSSTAPGVRSEVLVLGSRPQVSVENEGPGELLLQLDSHGEHREEVVRPGELSAEHELRGPIRVGLEPLGAELVAWRLVAQRCTGLRADLILDPGD